MSCVLFGGKFVTNEKPTVLIADDSPLIRYQLMDILEDLGFEIAGEASNGNEAVILYSEKKPDFVTLDIIMPDKGGVEALDEILKIDTNAQAVMITAIGKQDVVLQCLKKGAINFIVKPFNPLNIRDVFEKLLKRSNKKKIE